MSSLLLPVLGILLVLCGAWSGCRMPFPGLAGVLLAVGGLAIMASSGLVFASMIMLLVGWEIASLGGGFILGSSTGSRAILRTQLLWQALTSLLLWMGYAIVAWNPVAGFACSLMGVAGRWSLVPGYFLSIDLAGLNRPWANLMITTVAWTGALLCLAEMSDWQPTIAHVPAFLLLLTLTGAFTVLTGGALLLVQTEWPRFLASLLMTQAGWIVWGIGLSTGFDGRIGTSAPPFALVELSAGGVFLSLFLVTGCTSRWALKGGRDRFLSDFAGGASAYPLLMAGFLLGTAVLAGLPLTFTGWTHGWLLVEGAMQVIRGNSPASPDWAAIAVSTVILGIGQMLATIGWLKFAIDVLSGSQVPIRGSDLPASQRSAAWNFAAAAILVVGGFWPTLLLDLNRDLRGLSGNSTRRSYENIPPQPASEPQIPRGNSADEPAQDAML